MLATDEIHKSDPDFKLIYGCEAYFVDDMVPCVYGVKDQPLDGEFCVFDTETTGLDPGVESSGGGRNRLAITKAGNSHLRRLLVESSQSYSRGTIGFKSKELKKRQEGNPPEVVAYADRSNERLRRRYYRMTLKNGAKRNVAIVAVA